MNMPRIFGHFYKLVIKQAIKIHKELKQSARVLYKKVWK